METPAEVSNPASISAAFGRLAKLIEAELDFREIARAADPHELAAARAAEQAAVKDAITAREEVARLGLVRK